MPIAKEPLNIGFTRVANTDTYVPKSLVEQYGWADKVEDGPDMGGTEETTTEKAPKARGSKAA